ncbi:hypothetical protein DID76_01520 [Candidatus Marinamargulisbacteria bacterium SCGC AG-414-C22]|nr:hypothetical protein DID76_01520 [Candidatus Marinamargulisbacteria bacterium SCGC AG-414-C22]
MFKYLPLKNHSQLVVSQQKRLEELTEQLVSIKHMDDLSKIKKLTKEIKAIIMVHSDKRICYPTPFIEKFLSNTDKWFNGGLFQDVHRVFILDVFKELIFLLGYQQRCNKTTPETLELKDNLVTTLAEMKQKPSLVKVPILKYYLDVTQCAANYIVVEEPLNTTRQTPEEQAEKLASSVTQGNEMVQHVLDKDLVAISLDLIMLSGKIYKMIDSIQLPTFSDTKEVSETQILIYRLGRRARTRVDAKKELLSIADTLIQKADSLGTAMDSLKMSMCFALQELLLVSIDDGEIADKLCLLTAEIDPDSACIILHKALKCPTLSIWTKLNETKNNYERGLTGHSLSRQISAQYSKSRILVNQSTWLHEMVVSKSIPQDIEISRKDIIQQDQLGRTPLMLAIQQLYSFDKEEIDQKQRLDHCIDSMIDRLLEEDLQIRDSNEYSVLDLFARSNQISRLQNIIEKFKKSTNLVKVLSHYSRHHKSILHHITEASINDETITLLAFICNFLKQENQLTCLIDLQNVCGDTIFHGIAKNIEKSKDEKEKTILNKCLKYFNDNYVIPPKLNKKGYCYWDYLIKSDVCKDLKYYNIALKEHEPLLFTASYAAFEEFEKELVDFQKKLTTQQFTSWGGFSNADLQKNILKRIFESTQSIAKKMDIFFAQVGAALDQQSISDRCAKSLIKKIPKKDFSAIYNKLHAEYVKEPFDEAVITYVQSHVAILTDEQKALIFKNIAEPVKLLQEILDQTDWKRMWSDSFSIDHFLDILIHRSTPLKDIKKSFEELTETVIQKKDVVGLAALLSQKYQGTYLVNLNKQLQDDKTLLQKIILTEEFEVIKTALNHSGYALMFSPITENGEIDKDSPFRLLVRSRQSDALELVIKRCYETLNPSVMQARSCSLKFLMCLTGCISCALLHSPNQTRTQVSITLTDLGFSLLEHLGEKGEGIVNIAKFSKLSTSYMANLNKMVQISDIISILQKESDKTSQVIVRGYHDFSERRGSLRVWLKIQKSLFKSWEDDLGHKLFTKRFANAKKLN